MSIVNTTTGAITPVLIAPNGGFEVSVVARLADKLRIRIVDRAGNETLVEVPRYRDPDGSTVIGPEGGDIQEGDLTLGIKPGTFPKGAIVKFTPMTQAAIPYDPGPSFPFVSAFEITTSVDPQAYMNVSAPLPPGLDPRTTGIVARVTTAFGQPALDVVDTAKQIDGRLATSSPPCEGIVKRFGRYAMFLNEDEQMKFGIADREHGGAAPAAGHPAGVQIQNPAGLGVFSGWGDAVFPELRFEQLYEPSLPFIAKIESSTNIEQTIAEPLAIQFGAQLCNPVTGFCDNDYRKVCLPVPPDQPFRVVVRNALSGLVLASSPVPATPAGQSNAVQPEFFNGSADHEAPTVVWTSWNTSTAPFVLDSGKTIQVQFSEPVFANTSVSPNGAAWLENQSTGVIVKVALRGRSSNRLVTFLPEYPLPAGTPFVLNMPGLRDAAGNAVSQTLAFETFALTLVLPRTTPAGPIRYTAASIVNDLTFAGVPVPVSVTDFSMADIDFVTLRPEQTPSGKWETQLFTVGAGRSSQGVQLMTFSLTDSLMPQAKAVLPAERTLLHGVPRLPRRAHQVRHRSRRTPANRLARNRRNCKPGAAASCSTWPGSRTSGSAWRRPTRAWRHGRRASRSSIPGATISSQGGGCGTVGFSTSFNVYYSIFHITDLTDPTAPFEFSRRVTSDYGVIAGYPPRKETPKGSGVPRGFDLLFGVDIEHKIARGSDPTDIVYKYQSDDTVGAYLPVFGIGLELVDVGRMAPDILEYQRVPQGPIIENIGLYTYPYYRDLRVVRDRIVTVAGDYRDGTNSALVEVFDPSLNPIGSPTPLASPAQGMASALDFPLDMNGDGTPEPRDLVFVTGNAGVSVVDVDAATGATSVVGLIQVPTIEDSTLGNAVSTVSGTCPALTFQAGSFTYLTSVSTRYYGGTCNDVAPSSARVIVSGDITPAGKIRAKYVRFFRTGNAIKVRRLMRMEVDVARRAGYVAAEWEQGTFRYAGVMSLDLTQPAGLGNDADADGLDDRILGFTRVDRFRGPHQRRRGLGLHQRDPLRSRSATALPRAAALAARREPPGHRHPQDLRVHRERRGDLAHVERRGDVSRRDLARRHLVARVRDRRPAAHGAVPRELLGEGLHGRHVHVQGERAGLWRRDGHRRPVARARYGNVRPGGRQRPPQPEAQREGHRQRRHDRDLRRHGHAARQVVRDARAGTGRGVERARDDLHRSDQPADRRASRPALVPADVGCEGDDPDRRPHHQRAHRRVAAGRDAVQRHPASGGLERRAHHARHGAGAWRTHVRDPGRVRQPGRERGVHGQGRSTTCASRKRCPSATPT